MNFLSLIEAKREGKELSPPDFQAFVRDFCEARIPDYQMAAMLMAIFFRGLNAVESRALTLAMRDSGEVLKFPTDARPIVDKHSTGGVGDKVSLPLAPLLACLGFRVPMISGRGLGITGGTLDKLESIPRFTTQLEPARIIEQTQTLGLAMAGQTKTMVPADKKLYALRDATGTVPSIPLITASILSKKLAEGLAALVLDVKFGVAAFMQTRDQARQLANSLVTLARDCGLRSRALLTDMNTPLGNSAGNWLEVKEAVECLEGRGPNDLRHLVIECATSLLCQTGRASSLEQARKQATECLASGEPLKKWNGLLAAQGADLEAFHHKLSRDVIAPAIRELKTDRPGFVSRCDARIIGEVVRDLGGGRLTQDAQINPDVGVDRLVRPGDRLDEGAVLCRIHAASSEDAERATQRLSTAFQLAECAPLAMPLIQDVIESAAD